MEFLKTLGYKLQIMFYTFLHIVCQVFVFILVVIGISLAVITGVCIVIGETLAGYVFGFMYRIFDWIYFTAKGIKEYYQKNCRRDNDG